MPIPTGISLATKGVLCGARPTDVQYTGFIRREDELAKPIIKVEKFYIEDDGKPIIESLGGKIEVTSVEFIEKINEDLKNEEDRRY